MSDPSKSPVIPAHLPEDEIRRLARAAHRDHNDGMCSTKVACRQCCFIADRMRELARPLVEKIEVQAVDARLAAGDILDLRQRLAQAEKERDEASARRDEVWRAEAERSFEGIQPNEWLLRMFDNTNGDAVPVGVIHEIWKRNPRVEPLLARLSAAKEVIEGLKQIARHGQGCPTGWMVAGPCSCGFVDTLAAAERWL